jgi:hypothetical protein
VPRSRAAVPCLPAAGVFLEGDSARVINPPTGGLGGKTPRSPGRPQRGLEAVAAAPHGQAGPARYSIHITMNGTQSDCSHYICSRGLCPVRLPHGSRRRRGTPLIDYGAVTMGSTGIPLVGRTRRVGGHLAVAPPRSYSGRAWYTGSACSGHLRRPGDFHHRPVRTTLRAACRANGAAWISAAERVIQRLGVPFDVYIASVQSWEVLKLYRGGKSSNCSNRSSTQLAII